MPSVAALVEDVVSATHDVAAAYLFGSAARDELGPDSDLDVGVVFTRRGPSSFPACQVIEEQLERRLGRRAEVIDLDRAPVDLVQRVLRDGLLLIDRDPPVRVRFEIRRRNEWFDMQPLLRAYRRAPGPA